MGKWYGWLLIIFTLAMGAAVQADPISAKVGHVTDSGRTPITMFVILQRVYLDGEMSEEIIQQSYKSIDDVLQTYSQWVLVEKTDDKLVFQTYVDDISPLLKGNGYFGVDQKGTLTIYNGRPNKDNVIQSFFQIDIKKLESRKQHRLEVGIPILTKERYEHVLEAYKPYTIPTSKN